MNQLDYFIYETLEVAPSPLTKGRLLEVICNQFGVTEEQLKGKSRNSNLNQARQFYIWFLYKKGLIRTLAEIGEEVNRNHATVVHTRNKLEYESKQYEDVKLLSKEIESRL